MDSEFKNLGFKKYLFANGRRSLADSFTKNNRCGIYILHFENGEYYAGLAIDVVRRYAQHRKNHLDIDYVSFKEIAKPALDLVETETIAKLERVNKTLRNISKVSIIHGETDFDLLISIEKQEQWLNKKSPIENLSSARFNYPELRNRYTKKFEKFKKLPLSEKASEIYREYVLQTIPFPRETEYSFWSVSCMPAPGKTLLNHNIFWQQTFYIYENDFTFKKNGKTHKEHGLDVSIWVSKSRLFENYTIKQLKEKYYWLALGKIVYPTGGQDQQQIIIRDEEFFDFLADPNILASIKEFNLRLMRKGGCIYNRYHCFDLADVAIE